MANPQMLNQISEAVYKRFEPVFADLHKKLDDLNSKVTVLAAKTEAAASTIDIVKADLMLLNLEVPKMTQSSATQIGLLVNAINGSTKAPKGKKAAAAAEPAAAGSAQNTPKPPAAGDTPNGAAEETAAKKAPPPNTKTMYFRTKCKEDAAFMQSWIDKLVAKNPNFVKEMEADQSIVKKKTDADKLTAKLTYMYKALSLHQNLVDELDALRVAAKNKPAANMVTAEKPTPK